jgi:hypothetical protein
MGDPRRADGALPPQTFDPQTAHPLVPENDDDFELPITVEEDVDFRPTGMLTETSAETPVDVNVKERTEKKHTSQLTSHTRLYPS